MVIGVDLGNWNVKTSEGNIFPSRYTTMESLLEAGGDILEYKSIKYYLKEGRLENDYDKANKSTNEILLIYALAIQNTNYFKAVVGLPALSYKNNRDKFKDTLLKMKIHDVKLNGVNKKIIIDDILVFPEGAGAYFSLNNRPKNAVVIDIGGGTTNIVNFKNGKLESCTTLPKGMIELYNRIRHHINSTYTLKLELEDIEVILREGLTVDGEGIDFNFMKTIVEEFIEELMNELRNFPIRTSKVLLSGGGVKLLKNSLSNKIKGLEVIDNYLFANANGFKNVGVSKWKG
ncbi:StbA family protein [Clostridium sartagoforme AAU1]|uniref:StbA family protein n=1 Tax=Clostridium sartagoforme AAU1 TaxID=1202534 RepID=R9CDH4_9CLOT|nr:ParM/StbA family protein [Clostridium sartagoforme]EOR27399.1 StbA family protein [Clostridium sartagoforme AAU1]